MVLCVAELRVFFVEDDAWMEDGGDSEPAECNPPLLSWCALVTGWAVFSLEDAAFAICTNTQIHISLK